ncbi:tissue factor-like [Pelmatolapia mariae]|uniref:tissue factor-like n=1 Tax=Pelmatolapia mariae TaxID=158779 RepID=UPI002FE6AB3A
MATVKTLLWLGLSLSAFGITTADVNSVPRAQDVHWVSLDFTTHLRWSVTPSDYTYTVRFSGGEADWEESPNCIQISASECDLTQSLKASNRAYSADVLTEITDTDYELPHTYSSKFNPYRESNISAVGFTVEPLDDRRVIVNITDPLTSIYDRGKQLSIRDIFKKDLNYKISYYKSGSTGKRDVMSNSSTKEIPGLDKGESYCFMVAAFIISRPKATQHGSWSVQKCTERAPNILQELSVGAWVGAGFIMLTVLIIIVTVTVLCCRQRNKTLQTYQSSAPV